jgi:Cu/Zn superoxide dismutase
MGGQAAQAGGINVPLYSDLEEARPGPGPDGRPGMRILSTTPQEEIYRPVSSLTPMMAPTRPTARARIAGTGDSDARGSIEFYVMPGGRTRVAIRMEGLTPGLHDLDILSTASCGSGSQPITGTAGFPPIEAGIDGHAELVLETAHHHVTGDRGGATQLIGRAIAVKEVMRNPNATSAGRRVACGVVKRR